MQTRNQTPLARIAAAFLLGAFFTQSPSAEAKPVRQAKIRTSVYKNIFVQKGTSYDWRKETVCEREGLIDVYDYRTGDEGTGQPNFLVCDSTIGADAVQISVSGLVAIGRGPVADYPIKGEFKSMSSFLYVLKKGSMESIPTLPSLDNFFFTSDLELKNAMFIMTPNHYTTECHTDSVDDHGHHSGTAGCSTDTPEFFSAYVELVDDQK